MGLKSGQEWAGLIVCKDDTGALSTPSVGPVGTLYVNGASNGASVTVSGSNPYKWTVTLPALTAGDLVSMYVTATIDSVATAEIVAEDVTDTERVSDLNDPSAATIADAVWDEAATGHTDAGKAGEQLWTDIDAIKAKTDLISSAGSVTVASPVSGSNVTTIQGDDYDADAGRSIDWDVSTSATVTGGAVSVVLSGVATYTGSVVDADTVRLELTAVQTAAIPVGRYKYQVILTDTNGDIATLVEGTWTSAARVTA